jgi:hypothetical protein
MKSSNANLVLTLLYATLAMPARLVYPHSLTKTWFEVRDAWRMHAAYRPTPTILRRRPGMGFETFNRPILAQRGVNRRARDPLSRHACFNLHGWEIDTS